MQTFTDGQVVPAGEWEIMKKYGATTVRWTAEFSGVEKSSAKHQEQGSRIKLKMDMAGNAGAVIAYVAKGDESSWQAKVVGTTLQFEGRIVGIQFDSLPRGKVGYWITIYDSKLLAPSASVAMAERGQNQVRCGANKSLDDNGGSVFLNSIRAAMLD